MSVTTVKNAEFDVNSLVATSAASSSKKSTSKVQDFSSVFNNATQNSNSGNDTSSASKTSSTSSDNKFSVKDTNKTSDDIKDEPKSVDSEAVDEQPVEEEEKVDDTVIEEIATALNIILDQIKENLNVDDDAIANAMEDLDLSQMDLLNSDNLKELVASLGGEDSVISLVADEGLYSKLQNLTSVVDTQFESILDNTGLSEDELNAVLEKLIANDNPISEENNQLSEELLGDTLAENVSDEAKDEPVVIVEDNTTKPATTYSKLPENQTVDTSDTANNLQSDSGNANKTDKNQDDQSKDYSENQSFSQNQQTLNENVAEVATDTTVSYSSDTTESIMRQLSDTVKLIKEDNLTQMELQLHPASLGTVNVSLISKGGMVTAQFTTQSEQVKAAIEAQATQLQESLESQGVKVEAIEVAVESHQMERNLDENSSRQEKEGERAQENIKANRRASINLRGLGENGEGLEEIQGADDATRIAMELMSSHGNTMDLLA